MRLHLSSHVRSAPVEDFLVILDLQSATFHMLDPVARSMWDALLAAEDDTDAVSSLERRYAVDRPRLTADLEAFRHRCIEDGFLTGNGPPSSVAPTLPARRARRRWLVTRAWWCLFRTALSLSHRGLLRTYGDYSRWPVSHTGHVDEQLLDRALAAFAQAENLFLMKRAPNDCLPRSLALFRFLRLAGVPAEHCVGVRQFPFLAHAWVECDGRVVQDNPSHQLTLTTLARISA